MHLPSSVIVPLFPIGFVRFWCLLLWVIARIGGWHRLALRFPAGPGKPEGIRMYYMQTLELGGWSFLGGGTYKNCTLVGVAPSGLYLSVILPFRAGHAPILIPWNALGPVKTRKILWQKRFELTVLAPDSPTKGGTFYLYNAKLIAAIAPHMTPAAPSSSHSLFN